MAQDPFTDFENDLEKNIQEIEKQNAEKEEDFLPSEEIEKESPSPVPAFDYEKEDLRERAQRAQKEKYRVAEENHQLRQYLDEALRHTSQTSEAALMQMEQNYHLVLNNALETKRKALEEGDNDLALQADVEIGRSTAKLEHLENYQKQRVFEQQQQQVLQQQLLQQQYVAQQQAVSQQQQQAIQQLPSSVHEWVKDNPWFLPNSPYYDPQKSQEVQAYAQTLDKKMAREGRQSEYFTKDYFEKINSYVEENFGYKNRPVSYRDSNPSGVSGVGRGDATVRSREKVVLTEAEKSMAKQMGVPEETWARHKKMNQQKQKERSQGYGTY